MPTGYTAKLMEKGQSFKDFVLTCARAFGPCIDLKDESLSPAPKHIKQNNYYQGLKSNERELKRLLKMSDKQKEAYGIKVRNEEIKDSEDAMKQSLEKNQKIEAMLEKVNKWNPPTKDHINLKDFMKSQLELSKNNIDYYTADIRRLKNQSGIYRYNSEVKDVRQGITYEQQEIEKEKEGNKFKNEWLMQLYNSLKTE